MVTVNYQIDLEDKYTAESGRVYMTGIQAIVRLAIMQRQRDLIDGLNTAGFFSGYRGSPLGGLDKTLWSAKKYLRDHHIQFQPGLNEDLAATAIWGSQSVNLFPGNLYDGVFSLWYGKGPGVDRSGDVFKHANMAGTSRHGGVLVLAGDDHVCKSSTLPHQSEYAFMDALMPVLNPSNVQEIIDFGLLGFALSRYSGCWVGFKVIAETVDSSATVDISPKRIQLLPPQGYEMPDGGLHMRWPDPPLIQEQRHKEQKMYAALAFAQANRFDRMVFNSPGARLGIVTTGKSYLDVRQALEDLGIDERRAGEVGIRLYKVGMPWPLERQGVRQFVEGLKEVLVVEEKRAVIENQLKEQLYNWKADVRPVVVGEFDENGNSILPSYGEITPARVARIIADRLAPFYTDTTIEQRLIFLENKEIALGKLGSGLQRRPHFCSGCPHNTSTRVPEGSRAMAGIGCHYMVTWMDRQTATFTQMGGEGATWIGQAPFTETQHVFQNLGDGTYFHSGSLAVRAAVSAKVNITYKILYNDAVAMTGGQPVDGNLTVPEITHQMLHEGVKRIAVVTDDLKKYRDRSVLAPGVTVHHRDELDSIQREFREIKGVSVIVYDQTCAAEKRRRRKRGSLEDPAKRIFINERVCEGCGDCSVKSNCLSVVPVETELGRKRMIDQSSCNKDYTCANGFCPSFVEVLGGDRRRPKQSTAGEALFARLSEPKIPEAGTHYGIVVTGVGGTGVVTVGALLGMAAHLEGKGCAILDMTGLAQKYGAVVSHVTISENQEDLHAVRIAAGRARLLLGCDFLVAGGIDALSKLNQEGSSAVVNIEPSMTSDFIGDPDLRFPARRLKDAIVEACGEAHCDFVDASRLATQLMGDSLASNLFLVGYAYQRGLIPLSAEAILRAIELNGIAVDFNKNAFLWGRCAVHDMTAVKACLPEDPGAEKPRSQSLEELVEHRRAYLVEYQDEAYAERYLALIRRVREQDETLSRSLKLTEALARYYFKLLAYKDEFEVARLYTDGEFEEQLQRAFSGDFRIRYRLAPPLLTKADPVTGEPRTRSYGSWLRPVFKLLARCKSLRGTPFNPFAYTAVHRMDQRLLRDYEAMMPMLLDGLNQDNYQTAVDLLSQPENIRGYGHVREAAVDSADIIKQRLLREFSSGSPSHDRAA